jgi:hypothetical protein
MKKLLLATAAALSVATAAHATLVPLLLDVTQEGSLYRYTYRGTLAADQGLVLGSRLVIFDFGGFAGGIQTPDPLIVGSTELVSGLTAPGQTDDPTIENLVFTWNGPDFAASGGPFFALELDGLSALSTYSGHQADGFAAVTVSNVGAAAGTVVTNAGTVEVPVPEPASWALLLLGFGGVGAWLRRVRPRAHLA